MKSTKATILLALLFSITVKAQEIYSTVKIYPPTDKTEKARLLELLEIDHCYYQDGGLIAEISQSDIRKLRTTPYQFEILVPDVRKYVDKQNADYIKYLANPNDPTISRSAFDQVGGLINNIIPTPSHFILPSAPSPTPPPHLGYWTYAEMDSIMNKLISDFSATGLIKKETIGVSANGTTIYGVKISDNATTDDPNEPEVLYIGLQHAREAIGGSSMIFYMMYLLENYATDSKIKDLVDNREIFIIPCMNPDGWDYNLLTLGAGGSTGAWRKNRRPTTGGNFGVDLNRNWGVDWNMCGGDPNCGSNTASSDVYVGPSAFSEPETKAVRDFVYNHHFVSMIDQHAYGPYYSLPFGKADLHPQPDSLTLQDQQFYNLIPAMMGKYNGMRAGNSIQSVGYYVAGGVKDWMLMGNIGTGIGTGMKGKIYGMTGEGSAGGGTGGGYGNFWPPYAQITYLCKGMIYQNLQLALASGSYIDIQDRDEIVTSAKTGGAFNFKVKRIGLEDKPVTVSMVPLENIQSVASPVVISSLPNYFDTYNGSIGYTLYPSITNGQRIRFAWKVQTGGQTYYDTIVKFYHATPASMNLFTDDMETGAVTTKWTRSSSTSPTWDYSTDDKYAGTKCLTESPGANYTTNLTRSVSTVGSYDLSNATAAYLTFWVRHRAENFRDKLQVLISVNNGSTYTAVAGTTTVQEPGTLDGSTINGIPAMTGIQEDWIKVVYDLSAPAFRATQVKIRFAFTSDGDGSGYDFDRDQGFFIDNVTFMKSTSTLVTLPVNFISFTGQLNPDQTIGLKWQAVTDQKHKYFDVEKSTDGQNFYAIGRVDGNNPYVMTDRNPAVGNNFYRLKAVDINGFGEYSRVINIIYNPLSSSLSIFPNPASSDIKLKILLPQQDKVTITVTDIAGKAIHQEEKIISSSYNELSLNIRSWPSQLYIVKVRNSNGGIIGIQRFVKQ